MQNTMLYTGILVLAFMAIHTGAEAQKNMKNTYLYVDEDTTVHPAVIYVTYKDDCLYNFVLDQDKIVELFVNRRKIPADSFYVYAPLVKKLSEQIKRDKAQAEEDEVQASKEKVQAEEDAVEAQKDKVQAERDAVQAREDKVQAEKERVEAQIEAKQDRVQAEEDRKQAKLDAEQAQKDRGQARVDAKMAAEDRAIMKSLLAELVKQGLISDVKSVRSLHLNEDELIINGKLQSEELHKQFMAKFLVRPGSGIDYRHDN